MRFCLKVEQFGSTPRGERGPQSGMATDMGGNPKSGNMQPVGRVYLIKVVHVYN